MNLLESYKGRLAICEKYYSQLHEGAKMSTNRKMITAQLLDNTAKLINEAFAQTVGGTQRGDFGNYKQFCMDITAVTVPNLVVNDMFLVKPMPSYTGSVVYMEYGLGQPKGEIPGGGVPVVASPFTYGEMNAARMHYTSSAVVEEIKSTATSFDPSWKPVVGDVEGLKTDGSWEKIADISTFNAGTYSKARYHYDNVVVPQEQLPTLVGKLARVELVAKARRIAVMYSRLAAYQAQTDYGIRFEDAIAQQAQAELAYEIDSEAAMLVMKTANDVCKDEASGLVTWTDGLVDTISYTQKAEGFTRAIEQAKMAIYKKTGKLLPTWMLVSPDVMPILAFVPGFKPVAATTVNGPYVAGEVAGLKVIVSPAVGTETTDDVTKAFAYFGVLGADGMSATGLYAPYLAISPTQLLGFADDRMEQGFSTMYDMKIINENLLAKIAVTLKPAVSALDVNVVNTEGKPVYTKAVV